jgi:hypothetical protein
LKNTFLRQLFYKPYNTNFYDLKCSPCGEARDDLPDIGNDKPYYWFTVPEDERLARTQLTEDICIIDDEDYFVRGVINISIHDYDRDVGFGVCISQKKENFDTYVNNFDSAQIGPFFGWLSTDIDYYDESSLSLKTTAHFIGNGRPRIEIDPTVKHPLAIDQREGITLNKAWEIVHFYLDIN